MLSGTLLWVQDVRWTDEGEVTLAAGRQGVWTLRVDEVDAEPRVVVPPGQWTFASRLAASSERLVAAAPFGPLGWTSPEGEPSAEAAPLPILVDVDLHGSTLALLGTDRGPTGTWSPDGALAWTADLSDGLAELKPVAFAADGPGSLAMARCQILESGAIRFLEDGRLVVVPGVEPGVFLYSPEGRLVRTWQTAPLGVLDECELDDDEVELLQTDPRARASWIHRRAVVEDVIDLGGAPALVVRKPEGGGTSWELFVLGETDVERIDLPVRTESTLSHLRADRRGDRLVLVVVEHGRARGAAQAEPRLLVVRLPS